MKGVPILSVTLAAASLFALPLSPIQADTPTSEAQTALTTLLQSPDHPLPPGTTLRGVSVQNGLATVDFNSAFTQNFQGGDSEAAGTVNSVLRVLGRVPGISRVQFLENEQIPGAIGGLIVLSSPLPVIHTDQPLYYHRHLSAPHAKPTAR